MFRSGTSFDLEKAEKKSRERRVEVIIEKGIFEILKSVVI